MHVWRIRHICRSSAATLAQAVLLKLVHDCGLFANKAIAPRFSYRIEVRLSPKMVAGLSISECLDNVLDSEFSDPAELLDATIRKLCRIEGVSPCDPTSALQAAMALRAHIRLQCQIHEDIRGFLELWIDMLPGTMD